MWIGTHARDETFLAYVDTAPEQSVFALAFGAVPCIPRADERVRVVSRDLSVLPRVEDVAFEILSINRD